MVYSLPSAWSPAALVAAPLRPHEFVLPGFVIRVYPDGLPGWTKEIRSRILSSFGAATDRLGDLAGDKSASPNERHETPPEGMEDWMQRLIVGNATNFAGVNMLDLFSAVLKEVQFSASRSGGPGGQNVNKTNSKVTLRWDVPGSFALTQDQKTLIQSRLGHRLTREGILTIAVQETRSQLENKQLAIDRLRQLFTKAFERKKVRKKSKPGKAVAQARIRDKRLHGEKKKMRRSDME